MRIIHLAGLVACLVLGRVAPVSAGEYEKIAGGEDGVVGAYRFTDCVEPADPDDSVAIRTRADAVRRHNAHVTAVNAYFACLAEEAERDITAHYNAVSAALSERQSDALQRLEARFSALNALPTSGRRRAGRKGVDLAPTAPRPVEDQLLGGPGSAETRDE